MTIEPTPEVYEVPVNGVKVPMRVWHGYTAGGVEVEAYVFSIVPEHGEQTKSLRAELPEFMRPTREVCKIDLPDA
jgi:hypothetical protein